MIKSVRRSINSMEEIKSGITTRLVDYYIQELFENLNTWILIEDNPSNKDNNLKLCDKIKLRLMREHNGFIISQRENQLRLCSL